MQLFIIYWFSNIEICLIHVHLRDYLFKYIICIKLLKPFIPQHIDALGRPINNKCLKYAYKYTKFSLV